MPIRSHYPPGAPCWIDRISADLPRAETFYADVFGWQFADDGGYRIATLGGQIVAGFGAAPGARDTWTVYLASKDVDESAAALGRLGGRVVLGPMAVGDNGSLAVALDPAGTPFGLFAGARADGVVLVDEPGASCGYTLATPDRDAARTFYAGLAGADLFAGETAQLADTTGPQRWLVRLGVSDLPGAVTAALRAGARAVGEPTEGRVELADPLGARFVLQHLTGPSTV